MVARPGIPLAKSCQSIRMMTPSHRIIAPVHQAILRHYGNRLMQDLEASSLIGEYLGKASWPARLLCQMRTIHYLTAMYRLFGEASMLKKANELYLASEAQYKTRAGQWKQWPDQTHPASNLYELGFTIYAEAGLFALTKSMPLQQSARATLQLITPILRDPPAWQRACSKDGLVSQNPLMHLFEAFLAATSSFGDPIWSQQGRLVLQIIAQSFFDPDAEMIAEVITKTPPYTKLYFEPGHSYEWASLLLASSVDLQRLARSCNLRAEGLVRACELNGLDPAGFVAERLCDAGEGSYRLICDPAATRRRIWPQLERIRALHECNHTHLDRHADQGWTARLQSATTQTLQHFFDGLDPVEYLPMDDQPLTNGVKSTTGYHIINALAPQIALP
ncbi:MAG: AGE family epimerase/isomerase [Pseudomonadota bacterium]